MDDIKKKVSDGAKDTKKSSDLIKKYVSLTDSQGLNPAVKSINEFIAKYLKGSNGIINNSKQARDKTTKYFSHSSSEGLYAAIKSIKDFISTYLNGEGGIKNQSTIARELIKTHWEGNALEGVKSNINSLIEILSQIKTDSAEAKDSLNDLNSFDTKGLEDKRRVCEELKKAAQDAKKAVDDLNNTEVKQKKMPTGGGSNQVEKDGGRVDKFAKGGRVKKYNISGALNRIAQAAGEDTMIAVREGEGVFTEKQTDDLEEFIKLTPELIESSKSLQKYSKLLTGLNFSSSTAIPLAQSQIASGMKASAAVPEGALASNMVDSNNIEITIGDIQVNGVQDVNGLATQIKDNLPSALLQALNRR
jgi:valyl-tRNA synthetase